MNNLRRNSALTTYSNPENQAKSKEDLVTLLAEDKKQYTPDEIDELVTAIQAGEQAPATNTNTGNKGGEQAPATNTNTGNKGGEQAPATNTNTGNKGGEQAPATETLNKVYEIWTVDPKYKPILDNAEKVIGRKLTGFDKVKKKMDTSVTEERAEQFNLQSENTLERLYLKGAK